MGGCDLNCGNCGDCQGNYGPIASAFILVPDNFNSVTNFVPKLPVYRSLQVCDSAVENTGYGGRASRGCCDVDGGAESCGTSNCCGDEDLCASMGFIRYPQTIRPAAVEVCGKVGCNCGKRANHLGAGGEYTDGACCGNGGCMESNGLGFLNWPPIGYFKSVKACGPIDSEVCCKKHNRKGCQKCQVVAGPCQKNSRKSRSHKSHSRKSHSHKSHSHKSHSRCSECPSSLSAASSSLKKSAPRKVGCGCH